MTATLTVYSNSFQASSLGPPVVYANPVSTLAASVAAAPNTIFLAFLVDAEGRGKVFDNGAQSTGSAPVVNALPTITSLTQVLDPQGNATGGWSLQVAFPNGSPHNGSPSAYVLDQRSQLVVSSDSSGLT